MIMRDNVAQDLEELCDFVYLGSTVTHDNDLSKEVSYRISRAAHVFSRLRAQLWCRRDIQLKVKMTVYKAIVLPTLLYASETWPISQHHVDKLEVFQMSCLRSMLGVSRMQRLRNVDIRSRCRVGSVQLILRQNRLRWFGHVVRIVS